MVLADGEDDTVEIRWYGARDVHRKKTMMVEIEMETELRMVDHKVDNLQVVMVLVVKDFL